MTKYPFPFPSTLFIASHTFNVGRRRPRCHSPARVFHWRDAKGSTMEEKE